MLKRPVVSGRIVLPCGAVVGVGVGVDPPPVGVGVGVGVAAALLPGPGATGAGALLPPPPPPPHAVNVSEKMTIASAPARRIRPGFKAVALSHSQHTCGAMKRRRRFRASSPSPVEPFQAAVLHRPNVLS